MSEIITNSDKQTFALGKKIAKSLKGNAIIGLIGDLGAGKTVFSQGLANGLGIKKIVNSPTFVLMKVYPIKSRSARILPKAKLFNGVNPVKHKTIKNLVHIDAYRIKNEQDIINIGAEEYFNQPDTITLIEWADKIKKILPSKTKFIKIEILDNNKRRIKY